MVSLGGSRPHVPSVVFPSRFRPGVFFFLRRSGRTIHENGTDSRS